MPDNTQFSFDDTLDKAIQEAIATRDIKKYYKLCEESGREPEEVEYFITDARDIKVPKQKRRVYHGDDTPIEVKEYKGPDAINEFIDATYKVADKIFPQASTIKLNKKYMGSNPADGNTTYNLKLSSLAGFVKYAVIEDKETSIDEIVKNNMDYLREILKEKGAQTNSYQKKEETCIDVYVPQ